MHRVAIVKANGGRKEAILKSLNLLGGAHSFFRKGERVAIKPNLCDYKYGYPATTDIETMKIVTDIVRDFTQEIVIIESPNATTHTSLKYRALGYDRLEGVKLIDLNKDLLVKSKDFDKLVNLCNLKTSEISIVSCGMKNIFGCYPNRNKAKFHNNINDALVKINNAYPSDLVIVDALVGMEGQGPIYGEAVPMNLVVAGDNVVAVDFVACQLMGINPLNVNYILHASKRGLGNIDEIKILGEPIKDVKREFKMSGSEPFERKLKYFICSFDFAIRLLAKLRELR